MTRRRKKTRIAFTYSQHLDVITLVLQTVAKILQSGLYLEVHREKGNISPLITINMNTGHCCKTYSKECLTLSVSHLRIGSSVILHLHWGVCDGIVALCTIHAS